jgi:hypothetical protein
MDSHGKIRAIVAIVSGKAQDAYYYCYVNSHSSVVMRGYEPYGLCSLYLPNVTVRACIAVEGRDNRGSQFHP